MKRAILIICFGGKDIEIQLDKLKSKLNNKYDIYYAFTSRFFIKKYGYDIEQVLDKLYDKNYEELICMPLFVIDGLEYEKAICYISKYKEKFKKIKVTDALISKNIQEVYNFIKNLYTNNLLFICHGTDDKSNDKYKKLFSMFKDKNIFFANIESKPYIEDTIKILKDKNIQETMLIPFLLFNGKHIEKDIKCNIKNKLILNNINVKESLEPHLQYDEIIDIFIKKLTDSKEM